MDTVHLDPLEKGATLLKYCRSGAPHFRQFRVDCSDTQGIRLVWQSGSRLKSSKDSQVNLKDVKEIRIGQKTQAFEKHRMADVAHLSFSLIYGNDEKSLDIVCKDKNEFDVWVEGLNYLVREAQQRGDGNGVEKDQEKDDVKAASMVPRSRRNTTVDRTKLKDQFSEMCDVMLWGLNDAHQLGCDTPSPSSKRSKGTSEEETVEYVDKPLLLQSMLSKNITSISCGGSHVVALAKNGWVYSWGKGSMGRCGHGDESDVLVPRLISELKKERVTRVDAGDAYSGAITQDGRLYTWGAGDHHVLGHGDEMDQLSPTLVQAFASQKVDYVSCGYIFTAAVVEGVFYTWGGGEHFVTGHGHEEDTCFPRIVAAMQDKSVAQVAHGTHHVVCLCTNGSVYTWGDGANGQLGHGDQFSRQLPTHVEGLDSVVSQVSAGYFHSAALLQDGTLYIWGGNSYGQLGVGEKGNNSRRNVPQRLEVATPITQIELGANHSAAVGKEGELYTWGCGIYGRLGGDGSCSSDDDNDVVNATLLTSIGDRTVRRVACGGAFTAIICSHIWVPDNQVKQCMTCKQNFSFTFRRHHCRNCGGIFCATHSSKRFPLLKFGYEEPVRVCDSCHEILTEE